jgi:Tfp pilus assembly protein PilZ
VGERTFVARAIDISGGGIFVTMTDLPPIGEEVYLTFVLPGERNASTVKVIGEVKRVVTPEDSRGPGFGVLFIAVQPDSRMMILQFIEKVSIRAAREAEVDPGGGDIVEIKLDEA